MLRWSGTRAGQLRKNAWNAPESGGTYAQTLSQLAERIVRHRLQVGWDLRDDDVLLFGLDTTYRCGIQTPPGRIPPTFHNDLLSGPESDMLHEECPGQ